MDLCTLWVSNQTGTVLNNCHQDCLHLNQRNALVTISTSSKCTLTPQGFLLEKILPLEDKFVWLHCIQKGNSSNIHNVIFDNQAIW